MTNNKIILDMYYMEINDIETVENSPEGSADIFHFSITGKPMMFIESADKLEIFAVMRVEKDWARDDGTYTKRNWKTYQTWTFDFVTETVHIDTWPPEGEEPTYDPGDPSTYDWDRYGDIIAWHYPGPS